MRELKFRAWHPTLKLMLYSDDLGTFFDHTIYPCKDWKIQQFIGIKDIDKRDVYEGDVVIWPHLDSEGYHEIYFNEKELYYSARPLTDRNDIDSWLDSTHMKVMWTIFDQESKI